MKEPGSGHARLQSIKPCAGVSGEFSRLVKHFLPEIVCLIFFSNSEKKSHFRPSCRVVLLGSIHPPLMPL